MDMKFNFLHGISSFILMVITNGQIDDLEYVCYVANFEGFRLNSSIFMAKMVSQRIDCIMECAIEPCCRSINYKKSSNYRNETNCEMLHDLLHTYVKSTKLLNESSYDYVYLTNPTKNYNASCVSRIKKENHSGLRAVDSGKTEIISSKTKIGATKFLLVQTFESNILSSEPPNFTQQLEEWLPKTGIWSICWRGSRDGWGSDVFHSKCDDKIPTLTIVQVVKNNKTYVFGGYATLSWAGNGHHKSAPGSFLFSLRNNEDLQPFKASLKDENSNVAIYCIPQNGPSFGAWDLIIANNAGLNKFSHSTFGIIFQPPIEYSGDRTKADSLLAGSHYFKPKEIEVLYIKKS